MLAVSDVQFVKGEVIESIKRIESQKVDVGQNEREMFPPRIPRLTWDPREAVQPKLAC